MLLMEPLNHLAHTAWQDSQSTVHDPEIGFDAALGMEDISGFPQFFPCLHQVEDQCDLPLPVDSNPESAFAVGQGHTGFGS
jgi:hypothetical protein